MKFLLFIFILSNVVNTYADEFSIMSVLSSVEQDVDSRSTSGATKSLTSVKSAPAIVNSYT
ncbi:hypothetical protein MJH12_18710, partial [bacterium]|nr:hypothetical protein [bacterium]